METGTQKVDVRNEEQPTKRKSEVFSRTENHTYVETGADKSNKHKPQIKFSENHYPDIKTQETPTHLVYNEHLKNGKHHGRRHVESEPKSSVAFQKDSENISSDTANAWKSKNVYSSEPSPKKAAEARGSESSLYSKVSTCASLNPVLENATESTSDSNEVSRLSRESSPRESMDEALKSEKAFIEYVMSLPGSLSLIPKEATGIEGSSKSKQKHMAPALTGTMKVGLDHLDNLCKLMEQLSELKETNSKLQKRVQYLEDLKTLHDMHKEIKQDSQYGSENVLVRKKHMGLKKSMTSGDYVKHSPRGSEDFTEIPVESRVAAARTASRDQKLHIHRGRTVNTSVFDGRRRERSKSVGHEDAFDGKSRRIFPKWSKVKEALGWERPLPGDHVKNQQLNYCTEAKEISSKPKSSVKIRDSGSSAFIKGNPRVFTEDYVANLGIPYYSDYAEKDDESPSDSLTVCDMWKNNLNFRSSSEDISRLVDAYHTRRGTSKRDSESSTKRISLLEPPSEGIKRQKSTPSPSSERCRTYHEMLDLKPKSLTIERDIDAEQAFAKFDKEDGKKSHKSPWGRVKTIIERRRDSLKRRHFRRGQEPEPSSSMQARKLDMSYTTQSVDDLDYQSHEGLFQRKSSDDHLVQTSHSDSFHKSIRDDAETDKYRRKCRPESCHWKEKEDEEAVHSDRTTPSAYRCSKSASNQGASQFYDVLPAENRCISSGGGEYPTPSSSPQFHRKSRWTRMKKVLRGKKEEDGGDPSSLSMPASPNGVHEGTFDFEENDGLYDDSGDGKFVDGAEEPSRDKGQSHDVEGCSHSREMTRVGSDSFVHKLSLSSSAPISEIMLELERNLSEDFSRKIVEWERIRSLGGARTTSPKWDRKNSEPKSRSKKQDKSKSDRIEKTTKPKIKDLSWLEKELQKIEKEKLRLSKEKQKYEERAIRLERLRQTVLNANNTNKKEVLVRTSAGEFRFEGISDAFTKKLYEWETKRGVCPELSTIALLDSSLGSSNKPGFAIQPSDKCSLLHRAMSRSESSLPEIGQPSHTSSNSLPSLKPPDAGDLERIHLQSRASSEPDLTSLSAIANSTNNNRNGICLTPFQNVSVNEVFQQDETSRDSLCDLDKSPTEAYMPTEVTQLMDSYTEGAGDEERRDEVETEQREENYYSMLEENVILLEQLKKKEDICRRLEKELELLDEKVDEMNSHHQKEMERYREKLWEMHRPGTTPREAQGCLQIISELRTRIEELEKCSERLRNDRDTIEDSFRYHSEQQENMTLDLLNKMRELQVAGGSPIAESTSADDREFKRSKRKLLPILDMKIVDKLQSLSAQLVKQTTDLENTLAERTRQICQLRWELLHRDVSTVKLETELHTAHIQGAAQRPFRTKCEAKRSKYAHFRSWSSEEASNRNKQQEERYPEFDRLVHQSQEVYSHFPKSEFQATDLSCTVHELSKELLRLSTAAESLLTASEDEDLQDKLTPAKTENAVQRRKLSESELRESTQALSPLVSCDLPCVVEGMPRSDSISSSQITVRRNSADNISSVSGPDCSETSSLNEAVDKSTGSTAGRTLSPKRRVSTSSSTAEESSHEERFSSVSYCPNKDRSMSVQSREMILKRIPSRKEKKRMVDLTKEKNWGKYRSLDSRATSSDSKISLSNNFGIVKSGSVGSYDKAKKDAQPADRSLSTREKREIFANRREHALRRRLKPPSFEIKTAENSTERPQWNKGILKATNDNVHDKIMPAFNEIGTSTHTLTDAGFKNVGTPPSSNVDSVVKTSADSSSLAVVTVKLPRRKHKSTPKKSPSKNSDLQDSNLQSKTNQNAGTNVEATVTVVLQKKKRSVDRQLPKRSSTDGDVRELMKSENAPALPRNVIPGKATSVTDEMRTAHINKKQSDDDKKIPHQAINFPNKRVNTSQTVNVTHQIKENALNTNAEYVKEELDVNAALCETDGQTNEGNPIQNAENTFSRNDKPIDEESCMTKDRLRPGYFKSPSAPQLNCKVGNARKISREGAPNVRCLIEKYNQKARENLSPKIPRYQLQGSSIPVRKISATDWRNCQQQTNIPLEISTNASVEDNAPPTPCGPSEVKVERLHSPPVSPPTSPASRARAEALHKAKENFMYSSITPVTPEMLTQQDSNNRSLECTKEDPTHQTDSSTMEKNPDIFPDDDRVSRSSTRSVDSTSLVVFRTGESCKENRLARKLDCDRHKTDTEKIKESQSISAQSVSNPSLSKTVAGYEFKLPTSLMNLKLRRSKRKKDLATVSELCRQSLLITKDEDITADNTSADANHRIKSPRSCPSSPELQSKSKPKSGWLQWNILKHK